DLPSTVTRLEPQCSQSTDLDGWFQTSLSQMRLFFMSHEKNAVHSLLTNVQIV
ncbi:hypothetical protein GCK32_010174, partial [Trichostrongylus colubriformis]